MSENIYPDSFEDTRENLSALDIATDYLGRGWRPIPIAYRKKKPTLEEWQKLELTKAALPKYFNGAQQNVGVQLGPRSKGLTDIDLDCAEAIALARYYLPRTNACFGRASKRFSHFLYYIDDAPDKGAVQYKDIDGKKSIIELRIGGGKAGAQTIFPGSTHESGEPIEWASDHEPTRSSFAELKTAIAKIAVGSLLMRHWPQGSGHAASLALGGFLARAGWSEDEIGKLANLVVRDRQWAEDSVRTAKGSVEQLAKGEKVQGLPSLREQFGDEPAKAIAKILEYGAEDEGFACGSNGIPHSSQGNIRLAMEKLGVTVRHNSFADRPIVEGLAGFELLDDRAMDRLWLTIDEKYKFKPTKEFFWTVVFDEAYRNSFHPVRDYLGGLQWDGIKRVDTWLVDYAGADDSPYVRAVGSLMLIAGVRRIRSPGCKFDEMPVLLSVQGFDKSTALSILAVRPEWFSDDLPLNADSKKTIERLRGHWIVEAAELKGMRYGDIEHLKAFLSRSVDRARMSYDRANTELKRQCIIIGTTNHEKFLRDPTGNRRFWPVRGVKFNLEKLKQDRDQLWAEAAAREAEGVSIRLPSDLWSSANKEQEEHTIGEPWIEAIQNVLGDIKGKILNTDTWLLVGMSTEKRTQAHNERLGIAMKACGWERKKKSFGKLGTQWAYVPSKTEEGAVLPRVLVFHDWREGTTEARLAVDDDDDGSVPF